MIAFLTKCYCDFLFQLIVWTDSLYLFSWIDPFILLEILLTKNVFVFIIFDVTLKAYVRDKSCSKIIKVNPNYFWSIKFTTYDPLADFTGYILKIRVLSGWILRFSHRFRPTLSSCTHLPLSAAILLDILFSFIWRPTFSPLASKVLWANACFESLFTMSFA